TPRGCRDCRRPRPRLPVSARAPPSAGRARRVPSPGEGTAADFETCVRSGPRREATGGRLLDLGLHAHGTVSLSRHSPRLGRGGYLWSTAETIALPGRIASKHIRRLNVSSLPGATAAVSRRPLFDGFWQTCRDWKRHSAAAFLGGCAGRSSSVASHVTIPAGVRPLCRRVTPAITKAAPPNSASSRILIRVGTNR